MRVHAVGAAELVDEVARRAIHVEYRRQVDVQPGAEQVLPGAGARRGRRGDRVGCLADLLLRSERPAGQPANGAALLVGHQQQRLPHRVARAHRRLLQLGGDLADLRLAGDVAGEEDDPGRLAIADPPQQASWRREAGVAVDDPLPGQLSVRHRGQRHGRLPPADRHRGGALDGRHPESGREPGRFPAGRLAGRGAERGRSGRACHPARMLAARRPGTGVPGTTARGRAILGPRPGRPGAARDRARRTAGQQCDGRDGAGNPDPGASTAHGYCPSAGLPSAAALVIVKHARNCTGLACQSRPRQQAADSASPRPVRNTHQQAGPPAPAHAAWQRRSRPPPALFAPLGPGPVTGVVDTEPGHRGDFRHGSRYAACRAAAPRSRPGRQCNLPVLLIALADPVQPRGLP